MRTPIKKTSIIWTIPKETLQEIVDKSDAIYKVLEYLGLSGKSAGSYRVLKKRFEQDNIDISKLKQKSKEKMMNGINNFQKENRKTNEEIFVKSDGNIHNVKNRIIEESLIEYKCKECGIVDIWNDKKITLQLEHINGEHNDNRLENLCFLCPNCHSQTKTFGSRNKKYNKNKCKKCGIDITKTSTYCNNCSGEFKRKFNISKEELEILIKQKPFTEIGKIYNVTDNSIKRRCIVLGIDLPKYGRGYWSNKK